ncbi:putative pentatricopeptide repeat-containing protein At1g26500 [Fagus crenata]
MIVKRIAPTKPIINLLLLHHHLHPLSTNCTHPPQLSNPITTISPLNPDHLLRVCTILYQQQDSPDPRLHSKLRTCQSQFDHDDHLTHEFFLQVCNKFPYSWRPVYRFFQYTEANPCSRFTHTSVSFNKLLDVIGKSKNIELFWEVLHEMGRRHLVNDKTFRIALNTLAAARELKKCVEFFHSMNACGYEYSLETLNKVVETLCGNSLVEEAKFVVAKLKEWIKPSGVTYMYLIKGFCDVGDLVEASKFWNLMVDEGFQPDIDAVEKMMETFFKINRYDEALKLFQMMRTKRMDDLSLSTYRLVIEWMCKRGKIAQAYMVFEEMREREIQADNLSLASLIYGLLARGRVREAYRIAEGIKKPDVNVYHGLIKGLLKLRRASEATQVFREMIKRGCEPTMHTYIMLLQGHLGKRGRKGTDPLVNFETIFVGGLVKAGKSLEASKYVERSLRSGLEVPRFDYNKFLHYFSNEDGVVMFEEVAMKLREVGSVDLADIFESNVCGQFNEILLLFCILLGDVLRLTILLVLIVMRRSFELRVNEIVGQVDFDDKSSWEYLFKDYWIDLKERLSLTLDQLDQAKNPWKGSDVLTGKQESPDELYVANNDEGSDSDSSSGNIEISNSKRRRGKKRLKPRSKEANSSASATTTGSGGPSTVDNAEWTSKELLEFVMHMKNGDRSVLSQFDVQALLLEYIKRNKLRDPRRKGQIICDSWLESLFGRPRVGHFEMLKLFASHFLINSQADDLQGSVVDTETSQLETDGNSDSLVKAGGDKKRKTRKKGDERGLQSNLDDYAAIDNHIINLIYLRRNLVDELIEDMEKFHDKVVGSFVRIRISGSGQKQDLYRLVPVVGSCKAAEPYEVGKRMTDTLLEIFNLNKTEIISIDIISNQEFTEDECKRLRKSIKCGLISRLTVGDIQVKAMALQEARVKDVSLLACQLSLP